MTKPEASLQKCDQELGEEYVKTQRNYFCYAALSCVLETCEKEESETRNADLVQEHFTAMNNYQTHRYH